ncbi:DNA methyltransferase [Helicobacter sp.]|uniref:DNA methyltransferase n=1 Tax=Helicobacter sp. TaxID=218 RepID=UPI002605736D|nr:DNA methyltransferase [Helicobacter sp.]
MLICGDTLNELKKLEDNSVDVGVTSPPYNKQENKKGWLVKNVLYDNTCDKLSEEEYQANQIAVLNEMYRITKEGGSFFIIIRFVGKKANCFTHCNGFFKQNGILDRKLFGIGESQQIYAVGDFGR